MFKKISVQKAKERFAKKIPQRLLFSGSIFKCTSFPTMAGTYFGITYEEKLVFKDKIFVQLKDGTFAEYEDFQQNGKNAMKYDTKATTRGDYFVKNLTPLQKTSTDELTV